MSETKTIFELLEAQGTFAGVNTGRVRRTVFYGRVSTEHETQISALENQIEDGINTYKRHNVQGSTGRSKATKCRKKAHCKEERYKSLDHLFRYFT